MIVTMNSPASEQIILPSSSSSSSPHHDNDDQGGTTQGDDDDHDVPQQPVEQKQNKKRPSIVSIKKGATRPEQVVSSSASTTVELIDTSLDGVSRHICPKRDEFGGFSSPRIASSRPSIFAINKRMSSNSIGTWGSSRSSSTVAANMSSFRSSLFSNNSNRQSSYISLSSTRRRSSSAASTTTETPSDQNVEDLNDGTKISSNTINGFGVRFRSRTSIEQVKNILRLSAYDMDEIQAMYGTDEEELERKQILQEQILEFGEYANAMMDEELEYGVDGEATNKIDRRISDNSYTTIGIRDKCGLRLCEKIQSREAGWDAVMWDQHDQIQEITEDQQQLLDDEDITETENGDDEDGDGDDAILSGIDNIIILDDQRLADTYHQNASREAQVRAQEEAKELEQEVVALLQNEGK